jgi:nitrogen-specific signal transduction histidine kinase
MYRATRQRKSAVCATQQKVVKAKKAESETLEISNRETAEERKNDALRNGEEELTLQREDAEKRQKFNNSSMHLNSVMKEYFIFSAKDADDKGLDLYYRNEFLLRVNGW